MAGYVSLPILALAAVLQATLIPQMRILGGQPDLVLLCVIAWSVNGRLETGVTWALVGGIVSDLMSAAPLGTSALGLVLLVFAIDTIKRQLFGVNFLLVLLIVVVATALHAYLIMIVLAISGFRVTPVPSTLYVILPSVVYNLAFIVPVYVLIRWVQRRVRGDERLLA